MKNLKNKLQIKNDQIQLWVLENPKKYAKIVVVSIFLIFLPSIIWMIDCANILNQF